MLLQREGSHERGFSRGTVSVQCVLSFPFSALYVGEDLREAVFGFN